MREHTGLVPLNWRLKRQCHGLLGAKKGRTIYGVDESGAHCLGHTIRAKTRDKDI